MRVRYTETALAELGDIFSYIAQYNRMAAAQVVARIEEAAARLARFPQWGHPNTGRASE